MRSFNRTPEQNRPVSFDCGYTKNADGSVLVAFGDTKVLCTAFLDEKVPPFLKNKGLGWVTAEYGMLPGATHSRSMREAAKGKQSGRTQEIQRLIGRSLRMCVNTTELGERTVTVDCDVIQADGGTRTASVTGGCVALLLCLHKHRKKFLQAPVISRVAALSMGISKDQVLMDLDYSEDSSADVDLNLVMTHEGKLVEIQGTAEGAPFAPEKLNNMLSLASKNLAQISQLQRQALLDSGVSASWIP